MDQVLTVVLPMHNSEHKLRSSISDILDLAPALSRPLEVVVVDDGSTDDTYETACELARLYPQVAVLRHAFRQGIGAALELVRNRLSVKKVLVHDGISPIDVGQLQSMLQVEPESCGCTSVAASSGESSGSRRFAAVRRLHDQMEQVHRGSLAFRWLQLENPLVPRRSQIMAPSRVAQQTRQPIPTTPVQIVAAPTGINMQTQS
jgi:cellulose synthase/poly-beta-1,6-N-acetylglucosamine synthase-like glycosyltransferase